MKYIEMTVYTESAETLDTVQAVLTAEGCCDFAVNDPRDVDTLLNKENDYEWDYVDESVLEKKNERPSVVIYLPDGEDGTSCGKRLECALKREISACEVDFKCVDDEDWKYNWKAYFKPVKVTTRLVVKPTWEEYTAAGDELVIEIDPGMAFGTGTHETTSLCMMLMEKYMREGDSVLDVGCGSGILSIAAGLLGAGDVLGVDIDPVAVDVSRENVVLNGLSDKVRCMYGDLTKGVDYKADVVVANLMADLVKMLSGDVPRHLAAGGVYISSGILAELGDAVAEVIRDCGFEILEMPVRGDWCAIAAKLK